MKMLTESQARAITDKLIGFATADECSVQIDGVETGNIRFARNAVSTSGLVNNLNVGVQVAFGKRVGTATTNQLDDASLKACVQRAEELARLAPENPEFMPAIDKQAYKPTPTWVPATAAITPEQRAQAAAASIEPCRREKLVAAGFLSDTRGFQAIANSKGNFGYQTTTSLDYTCTVRTEDGRGSGWVARNLADVGRFKPETEIQIAMQKARDSAEAKALEPGKYTVILEPAAAAGLINFMMFSWDARQADEGRSFLSKKGGGNRIGEQVFDERVTLYSDPWNSDAAVLPWDKDGLQRERTPIVTKGRVDYLQYSRFWAKEKGQKAVGQPGNIVMEGGSASTMDMVRSTKRGLLVTRTWYIRMVDPQTVLLTGLTRDGTFYIENGKILYPVKNFRFNESPVIMLNNVEEFGRPERLGDDEAPLIMVIPPMKVRDFTFTSLSDAV